MNAPDTRNDTWMILADWLDDHWQPLAAALVRLDALDPPPDGCQIFESRARISGGVGGGGSGVVGGGGGSGGVGSSY